MKQWRKKIGLTSGLLLLGSLILYSCSDSAKSSPNFIFKPAPSQGAAFKMNDQVITEAELYKGIEGDLYDAEMKVFEIKLNRLHALVMEKLMEADPNKKGLTNDEFLDRFIAQGIKVEKKEIDAFIKERGIPQEHINEQMNERIVNYLTMEKKKVAVEAWMGKQTAKSPVEVYIQKPTRPVFEVPSENAPFIGKADAKVTVVEFSDFQCPYCAKGAEVVTALKKKYGDKIKVVFKNFPLPFHNHARTAAMASLCANAQDGKHFWKLHDHMFANQTKLSADDLKAQAKTMGLKSDEFNECLDKEKFAARVDQDVAEGQAVGVKSTPTFFVNGMLINGAQPLEVFSELIDEQLKK